MRIELEQTQVERPNDRFAIIDLIVRQLFPAHCLPTRTPVIIVYQYRVLQIGNHLDHLAKAPMPTGQANASMVNWLCPSDNVHFPAKHNNRPSVSAI